MHVEKGCFDAPSEMPVTFSDRFGRTILARGSGKVENLWRHFRVAAPEKCSLYTLDIITTQCFADWNFNREVMFNAEWPFLPFSPHSLPLVVYAQRSACAIGIHSIFPPLALYPEQSCKLFGWPGSRDSFCESFLKVYIMP